jgi:hypothetical protein
MKSRTFRHLTVVLLLYFIFTPITVIANAEIANSIQWHALIHYRPALLGGVKSTIDTDNFFLAPDGKTNPISELQATQDLFLGTDTSRQCLFPARYSFLKENNLINYTLASFLIDRKWEELQAMKDGNNGSNINYNAVKLL